MKNTLNQIKNFFRTEIETTTPSAPVQTLTMTVDLDVHEKKFVNQETRRMLMYKTLQCRLRDKPGDWTSLLTLMPDYGCDYAFASRHKQAIM